MPTTPSWQVRENAALTLARNVSTRYVLLIVNMAIGLMVLPYNVRHLGSATYGLWMLAASVATHFTVLDLGFGDGVVRYVAEFRARRDARALNEVISTIWYVYAAIGGLSYLLAVLVAVLVPWIFNLEPGQVQIARAVLLIVSLQVAFYFWFCVYGGVVNGFEQYHRNNVVGLVFNVAAAAVNVLVLWFGYGLIELVTATTILRIAPLWVYRRNAYKVFPELRIRREYFRRDRLRELSGYSVYLGVVDWATRLTYATDALYLGVFMNTAAVGVYAIAQRLAEALLNLTSQLHTFLLPTVVYHAVDGHVERQQSLMVKATRFQLAIAMCLCGGVAALADALIRAWIGTGAQESVRVTQLLAVSVVLRAWTAMPITLLQGTGRHRFVAGAASACAVANLLLSIPLIKMFGVVGVALGTIIPVAVFAVAIFVRSCLVVGLSVWQGTRQIVWPTVWPAAIVIGVLSATTDAVPPSLIAVLMHLAFGGLLYMAIFTLCGLDKDERQWLFSTFTGLRSRYNPRLAAESVLR